MRCAILQFCTLPLLLMAAALSGCGSHGQQPLRVVVIGEPQSGIDADVPAQLIRSATTEGLVALDEEGKVVPALADRWIITDDGESYIFRLRDGNWPDGSQISGESARNALRQAIANMGGTPLAIDLASIDDIRAMAGRVVEIRLSHPMPDFLQLLAQPELGLTHRGKGAGPMMLKREGAVTVLTAIPPEKRGLPAVEGWSRLARPVRIKSTSGANAVADFAAGKVDVVLGGRLVDLPRLGRSALGKNNARLDPVIGLFGLVVQHDEGLLGTPQNREALAMAIDREALAAKLGVPGWQPTTRMVAPGTDGDAALVEERWTDMDLATRRAFAADRIASWAKLGGHPAQLRIALPDGPGADLLATQLTADFATIGIAVVRVGEGAPADLRLLDRVARYPRAAWFLGQFACSTSRRPCSRAADTLATRAAADAKTAPLLYAQAERALAQSNIFIPLGAPIRWSLVGTEYGGFSTNRWGFHPLSGMALRQK